MATDSQDCRSMGAGTGQALVVARDAGMRRRRARSFEFVTFEARSGEVLALVGEERPPLRDLVYALAGLVMPTEGSLAVCGEERAQRGGARPRFARQRPARGTLGVSALTGVAAPSDVLTVEEAVAQEFSLWGRETTASAEDVLGYLASFELATEVDRRIGELGPEGRARLSAALAFVCRPRVALVDLTDPFAAGLAAADGAALVRMLGRHARACACAAIVATTDLAVARAADGACGIDLASAEALAPQEDDAR